MSFCSVVTRNFVAHARVLAETIAEHHDGSRLRLLIIDDELGASRDDEPFVPLALDEVGLTATELRRRAVMIDAAMRDAYRYAVIAFEAGLEPPPPDPFLWPEAFLEWLAEPHAPGTSVSRHLAALRDARADLRAAFPDVPGRDDARLERWASVHAPKFLPRRRRWRRVAPGQPRDDR